MCRCRSYKDLLFNSVRSILVSHFILLILWCFIVSNLLLRYRHTVLEVKIWIWWFVNCSLLLEVSVVLRVQIEEVSWVVFKRVKGFSVEFLKNTYFIDIPAGKLIFCIRSDGAFQLIILRRAFRIAFEVITDDVCGIRERVVEVAGTTMYSKDTLGREELF